MGRRSLPLLHQRDAVFHSMPANVVRGTAERTVCSQTDGCCKCASLKPGLTPIPDIVDATGLGYDFPDEA